MNAKASVAKRTFILSPLGDFLLVGGLSLLLYPLVLWAGHTSLGLDRLTQYVLVIAFVINYPHFAYSYQLFYTGFLSKLHDTELPKNLRRRYAFAGIAVPVLILCFYAVIVKLRVVGYAVNAMFFFVGWHYVKQGYGVLVVLSGLKGRYFNATEKRLLLFHAYAVWLFTWICSNFETHLRDYNGVLYSAIPMPEAVVATAFFAVFISGIVLLHGYFVAKNHPPINGLMGYIASSYLWLLFAGIHPALILVMPMFHSLQYVLFVWQVKLGEQKAHMLSRARTLGFMGFGILLGMLFFELLPRLLDNQEMYDTRIYGSSLFLVLFVVFINIHHYFMDNVIWKKENRAITHYLFT